MVRRLVILLLALAVVAVPPALAAGGPVRAAHRQAAVSAADRLLSEVVVPRGSTRVASEPAGSQHMLDRPENTILLAAMVQRTAFWTTAAPPGLAIAAVRARVPAGWRVYTGGSSPGLYDSIAFVPVREAPLVPRELSVTAVALKDGATGIRADAQVAYVAPRLPAQRIPSAARVLEITVRTPPSPPSKRVTVTRRAAIRRIAAAIDALPFTGHWSGVAISCPAMLVAPLVTFTFRATAGGPALARVSEMADTPSGLDPCDTTTLVIRGHPEPRLMAGGKLLRVAGAVLGVRLPASP